MADTARGDWPDEKCSDCKKKGVYFQHWGSMVPPGKVGQFCGDCWEARMDDCNSGKPARPLGQMAPQKTKTEIPTKAITVITKNSTYRLGEVNEKGERTISRDEKPLNFTRCRIIFLALGKDMEFDCLDGLPPKWYTTSVRSIR